MGLWQRFMMLFRAKASSALDRAEDPRQTIDYAYNRQLELLQQMRRGVADVATARKRIELQANQLQVTATKLEGQARQALTQNREDLAREALGRRAAIDSELTDLRAQQEQLQQEERRMLEGMRLLEDRVAQFRRQKETVKATYTAAEARARVGESMTGLSKEMSELGLAMQRAEDRIAQTTARAAALDELMSSGQLENLAAPGDRIQAELNVSAQRAQVDADLAKLKREIGSAPQPPALEEPKTGQP